MAPKQPKDYPSRRQEETTQASGSLQSFLSKVAGPLFIAVLLAGVGWGIDSFRADIQHDERISVLTDRLNQLETIVNNNTEARLKGERFTREQALAQYEKMHTLLTQLQIDVARLKGDRGP